MKRIVVLLVSDLENSSLKRIHSVRFTNSISEASNWVESMPSFFDLIVINTEKFPNTEIANLVKKDNGQTPVILWGRFIPIERKYVIYHVEKNDILITKVEQIYISAISVVKEFG